MDLNCWTIRKSLRWSFTGQSFFGFHAIRHCQNVGFYITSWEIDGETVETVSDFIFLGSKITVDDFVDCSHEIKRRLLLGRKVMTNLDSIFKSRDITLPTKVRLSRLWFFLWSCMDVRVGL